MGTQWAYHAMYNQTNNQGNKTIKNQIIDKGHRYIIDRSNLTSHTYIYISILGDASHFKDRCSTPIYANDSWDIQYPLTIAGMHIQVVMTI